MDRKIVRLSKPVAAHGEEINTLELRELTTEDIIRHGYPFTIYRSSDEGSTETRIQPNVIANYAVDMAGVPRSTIKSLCLEDFMKLQEVIMDFFGGTGQGEMELSKP